MIGPFLVALILAQSASAAPSQTSTPPSATAAQVADTQPWPPAGAFRIGAGVTAPEVLKEEKPQYTAEAMRARIEGSVEVEAIVLPDGTVGPVRVVRSLDKDYGLDDQASAAVKRWRFKPGKKDGVDVPVLVAIELSFKIRSGPGKR